MSAIAMAMSDLIEQNKRLQAEVEALRAAIPPGYVVVPVEPTDEMEDAADREGATSARKIYAAMIAARPGGEG